MLGEQITELKGKTTGRRVLDAEGPIIETSVSASGSARGTQVNESITYVAKPVSSGVLHGKGRGVIMAGNSEMATLEGEGIGRINANGVKWRGAIFLGQHQQANYHFLTIL